MRRSNERGNRLNFEPCIVIVLVALISVTCRVSHFGNRFEVQNDDDAVLTSLTHLDLCWPDMFRCRYKFDDDTKGTIPYDNAYNTDDVVGDDEDSDDDDAAGDDDDSDDSGDDDFLESIGDIEQRSMVPLGPLDPPGVLLCGCCCA